MARFLLAGGLTSSLVRFRGPLIDAALAAGHEVICVAGEPDSETVSTLERKGVRFFPIEFERTGTSMLADVRAVAQLVRVLRLVRPDVLLGYTVKPALYSCLASLLTGIGRPYAMLTGLGYALTPTDSPPTFASRVAHFIARRILPRAERVLFHNRDDRALCESTRLIRPEQGIVVNGSGVDLESFPPAPLPSAPLTFLFVARLLRDKGIEEFVQAACALHREFPNARFRVVGEPDATARSVTQEELAEWSRSTPVEFVGALKQPWSEFAASHVFVLPSTYGEGLPRTLLEAMAVGRAIITTDMPGCREAVVDGNGILVAPHNVDSLLAAMRRFAVEPELAAQMGARGRALALTRFDARIVAATMLEGMDLLDTKPRVLHVITGLNAGGAEASLVRVIKSTSDRITHVVVSLTSLGTRGAELQALGVRVVALGLARGSIAPRAILTLRRLAREVRPDCTQGWMYHGNLAASLLRATTSGTGPVFWNVRHALDAWTHEGRTLRALISISARLSWTARSIVFNSHRAASQHAQRGFNATRALVIPNGVDTTRFSPNQLAGARLRAQFGIPSSDIVIGMIARVDPLKDHDTFISAIEHDRDSSGRTWYLLAGTGTQAGTAERPEALDARFRGLVNGHPELAARIIRLGERHDIPDILNACDLVTLPSRSEGSPNAVAEAMACGVPCIVTDVGDAAQLIEGSGVIVPVGAPERIAEAWHALRCDSVERTRRGQAARERILSAYTTEVEGRAYAALWSAHTTARGAGEPHASRALMVTTDRVTIDAFLLPFGEHFRARGWRVDCAAAGVSRSSSIASSFDRAFEIPWSRWPLSVRNFSAVRRVRRIVEAGRYDIVHVHTPVAAFLVRFALRHIARPAIIYTAHGFHADRSQAWWTNLIFRALEKLAAPWGGHLVTINADDFARAQTDRLAFPDRLHLHPGIGVDLSRYHPVSAHRRREIRDAIGVGHARSVVVVVGEFSPRKRQLDVIDALARSERFTTDRPVVLFVGDGPLRARAMARAEELGVSASVRFLGHRSDVHEILAASDALLLCSAREGLPRCVLEAFAAEVPVVGTAAKGTRELLAEGRGLLVPIGDVDAIATAMIEVRAHPDVAAARAQRARRWVENHGALEHVLRLHETLYAAALGQAVQAVSPSAEMSSRVNSAA